MSENQFEESTSDIQHEQNKNKPEKSDKSNKLRLLISAGLVVFLLGIGYFIDTVFPSTFRNNSYDILTQISGGREEKASDEVMLLLIDEASLKFGREAYGLGRWPWPREIYAAILQYMNQSTPPSAVFFDILFSEEDLQKGNDATFSEYVEYAGNVFHNVLLINDSRQEAIRPLPSDMTDFYAIGVKNAENINFDKTEANNYTLPIECLRLNTPCQNETAEVDEVYPIARGMAIASFKADPDGLHRRGRILFSYDQPVQNTEKTEKGEPETKEYYFPSISLAAISALQNDAPVEISEDGSALTVGKYDIPVDENGDYMINFYDMSKAEDGSTPNRVQAYSMSALFQSAVQLANGEPRDKIWLHPDDFKNKAVIIGCSAVGCQDLKNTPVGGTFPGPELHATMISNILQNNHITMEPETVTYLVTLLIGFIAVASVLLFQHPAAKFGIPAAVIVLYVLTAFFLFSSFNYITVFLQAAITGILGSGLAFAYLSLTEGAEKRKYSKILGNMVDPGIVSEALNDLEALKKGGEKEITAFFSDVASFSTISEKLSSDQLAALLNEYLSDMTEIMKHEGGTLDKYIGDAIVGIFNAPINLNNHPLAAAKASLQMRRRMLELQQKWQAEDAYCPEAQVMNFRIGLNTGIAKVGFMGTDTLASYTMMGDTVNLAARLEAAAKDYGIDILISQFTKKDIEDEMVTRELDIVRVKGKSEPVTLYELVGEKGEVSDEKLELVTKYEEGLNLYKNKKFREALQKFEKVIEKDPENKAAAMLIDRCEHYLVEPPPENWDGVFTRTHK